VDDRERIPLVFSAAVATEVVHLPVADYSLRGASDVVAIERKRLDELATCCGTEREGFIEQIERLRPFPVRALVIEADMADVVRARYESRINPLSVLGTLVKFMADWQVPVIMAGDAAGAALIVERTLIRVAKRGLERPSTPHLNNLAPIENES
jgi:ERCC4-type nuclease